MVPGNLFVSKLNRMFNVNKKRVYIVGFSNGGCMAFRCGVEMSDIFAAIVQSGGTYSGDCAFTPVKNIPVTFQLGNKDGAWFGKAGGTVPMSHFKKLLNKLPIFQRLIKAHAKTFSFKTSYTISGDENIALLAKFKGKPDNGKRSFNFIFVKGLQHEYPNGRNHPIYGAKQNWSWLRQFTLE
jgi:poly(3-hydroxybutyrate) depolymerase